MIRVPKLDGSGEHFQLVYDAWNRLAEVYDDDGTTLIATYEYDGKNRRIEKVVEDTPDVNTHFFHKGNQVIETREATDSSAPESMQPKYQNVWSPRYIDSLILRDENIDTDGDCDDGRVYYLADANYNVTALVAESSAGQADWTVRERYTYDAYGNATILDASFAATTGNYANTTLYTGRELDSETGLYYYRARYYHAQLGRFISRDPLGYRGRDMNVYRYVGSNPATGRDPTGLVIWTNLPTNWIVGLGLQPPNAGAINWAPVTANALATTVPRADITFTCKCVWTLLGRQWKLSGQVNVSFWVEIRLLAAYPSPGQGAWVRRAEGDHEADMLAWAAGQGPTRAAVAENLFSAGTYSSRAACGTDGFRIFATMLTPSIQQANAASINTHDVTGLHTWGGQNPRP